MKKISVTTSEIVQNVIFTYEFDFSKVTQLYGEKSKVLAVNSVYIPTIGWSDKWQFSAVYNGQSVKEQLSNVAFIGGQTVNLKVLNSYGEIVYPDFQLYELTKIPYERI